MTLPAFLGNSGIKNFSHGLCIRTGHVFVWGTNPLSRLRRHLPPAGGSLSTQVEALAEPVGEPLPAAPIGAATSPEGGGLGKTGRSCSHSLTAGRSLPLSCKLFASAKASPFRERWHGEAVTERVAFRNEPSQSRCARQLVPLFVAYRRHLPPAGGSLSKGEPLAEPESFVLHSSTAGRSQPISGKLYALAKASPFRERWHGEAVTERVPPRLTAAFGRRFFHGPAERPSSLESRY